MLVVALALVAACAPASAADAAKQTTYSDYASLLAPAMLLAHGDWEVRAWLSLRRAAARSCLAATLRSSVACVTLCLPARS